MYLNKYLMKYNGPLVKLLLKFLISKIYVKIWKLISYNGKNGIKKKKLNKPIFLNNSKIFPNLINYYY